MDINGEDPSINFINIKTAFWKQVKLNQRQNEMLPVTSPFLNFEGFTRNY